MDSGAPYPPKYVMLNNIGNKPPPQRRHVPRYRSHNRNSGVQCCLKCICCCYCFLFILILVLFGAIFLFLSYFKPEKPSYNVSQVEVKAFDVQQDLSLFAKLSVSVKADNLNHHVSFIYGKDSSAAVLYTGNTLCSGELPAFHQPTNNITMMTILMEGKNAFGSGLQESLVQDQKKGKIPILVTVRAPVSVVIAGFSLWEVSVLVNCSLVVDNISPNHKIGILSSKYTYEIAM